MSSFEIGCYHPDNRMVECSCGECVSCPVGSRAMMCGACGTHTTMCEVCDEQFVPDNADTICLDCQAFADQEYRNDNPQDWGYAYINKMGGWER